MVSKRSLSLMKFAIKQNLKNNFLKVREWLKKSQIKMGESLRAKLQTL
ncbi:hypothetical protein JP0003_11990 [Helicobacter pylori]